MLACKHALLPFENCPRRAQALIVALRSLQRRAGGRLCPLKCAEKRRCLRGLRSGGENRLLVGFEHAQPGVEILRMISARRGADAEISAEKSGSEFPEKLLDRVGVIAETLAELPIAAALNARPVNQLMKLGRIVGLGGRAGGGADKGFAQRQMYLVGRATIEGAASAVMDDSAGCGDKSLGAFDRLDGIGGRLGQGRGGVAFDLLGGKDGRCARKKAGACLVLAALVGGDGDLFVEDDMRGLLALADLSAGFGPLLVGAPGA